MTRNVLTLIDLALFGLAALLLLLALFFHFNFSSSLTDFKPINKTRPKPSLFFTQKQQAYDAIESSLLRLVYEPPSVKLPDLRQLLTYYGPNGRPDIVQDQAAMHFSLTDGKSQATSAPGKKIYLLYDRTQTPNRYIFSPQNEPTSLWIEADIRGNEALVKVYMKGENEQIIHAPPALAELKLAQKEMIRSSSLGNWEIGKWKVDGTLLGRQKARWYGADKFLEKHGGEEYKEESGKQRIDFGENDEVYSIYVGLNDTAIWEDGRWRLVKPGPLSQGKPLLLIKKIDERLMNLDLWDSEGKNKIVLTLLKSTENWSPQKAEQDFKFIAARTRSQYIFEVQKERVLLKPQDWLIFLDGSWKALSNEQEIDDYVNRKIRGTLFVFDGIAKKEERQMLQATLFSPSRSDSHVVEIPLPQGNVSVITVPAAQTSQPAEPLIPSHMGPIRPPINMPLDNN